MTEAAALGLLALSGPLSGYDLSAAVNRSVGFVWAPARSQIYTVLKRLERRGLIEGESVAQQGRPDKVLFSVTKAGQAAVVAWLEQETIIAPEERDVLVLKVFFAELAAPAAILAQLDRYGEAVAQRLAVYESIERQLLAEPETPGQLAAVRLGIALMRATRTWSRRTRATLTATPASVDVLIDCPVSGDEGWPAVSEEGFELRLGSQTSMQPFHRRRHVTGYPYSRACIESAAARRAADTVCREGIPYGTAGSAPTDRGCLRGPALPG